MTRHLPNIDLRGFQRLNDLERRIWYSPVAIAIWLVGLGAAANMFWGLSRGIIHETDRLIVSYALFLAVYGGLFAYYFAYRFRYLKCPRCQQRMQPFVTDLDDSLSPTFLRTLEIAGRHYRAPYDEDDHRPWVRLMIHVRACPTCRTFVNCSRLHFETCTEDELGQIRQRIVK